MPGTLRARAFSGEVRSRFAAENATNKESRALLRFEEKQKRSRPRLGNRMKQSIRVAFALFWPGFTPDSFKRFFPFGYDKYDLVLSPEPEDVFYSVFSPHFRPYADPSHNAPATSITSSDYLSAFFT